MLWNFFKSTNCANHSLTFLELAVLSSLFVLKTILPCTFVVLTIFYYSKQKVPLSKIEDQLLRDEINKTCLKDLFSNNKAEGCVQLTF